MKNHHNMSPEQNASPPKKSRYITQFQDSWVKEWPGKIARSHKDSAYALCRLYLSDFGIGSVRSVRRFYAALVTNMVKKLPYNNQLLIELEVLWPDLREKFTPNTVLDLAKRLPEHLLQEDYSDTLRVEFMEFAMATDAELPPLEGGLDVFWAVMATRTTAWRDHPFATLSAVRKLYLHKPQSNADSERAFSMVNKIDKEYMSKNATMNYSLRHMNTP